LISRALFDIPAHIGETLPVRAWSGLLRRTARRPILARLSPCGGRLYGRPAVSPDRSILDSDPMHLALLPDRWGAEEMPDEDHIEIERLLSPEDVARACGLSRRPSIGRLRGASCGRRGSATGSGCIRSSWSVGLPRKRAQQSRQFRFGRGVPLVPFGAAACARCSMRRRRGCREC
jgi:hypothetical protein